MDIDIDVRPGSDVNLPGSTKASLIENLQLKKHLVGYYFQNIPVDKQTNLSAIPYDIAPSFGYLKIDILNLSLLSYFESNEDIDEVLKMSIDWNLLKDEKIVNKLFHIKNHFDVVNKCSPKSIEDLADILALIRPNKKGLIDKYIQNKKEIRKILYDKHHESDLRKSHALAYAMNIVLQMNLITLGAEF
jgi:DNA polymerase III alpha subunit